MQSTKVTIQDGRITFGDVEYFLTNLPDGDWRLTAKRWSEDRSLRQNNYLHGAVIPLYADHAGYTTMEAKEILKWLCAPIQHLQLPNGAIKEQPQPTSSMTVQEFSDFLMRIEGHFAEEGLAMPDPEEFYDLTRRT